MRRAILLGPPLCGMLLLLPSCAHVKVDPIEVKPIHIVADINIRVDRELDNFFAFENQDTGKPASSPSTQPSAAAR